MNMRSVLAWVGLCALTVSLTLGCAQNLADDPIIKKQAKQIETMNSDLQVLSRKLASLSAMDTDFQKVSQDVQKLKESGSAGSSEAVQALQSRLAPLENSLKTLTEAVATLQQKPSDSSKLVAGRTTPEGKAAPAATSAATAPGTAAKTVRVAAATSRRAETVNASASGGYHLIKPGETLDGLASQYKIAAETIRLSNHLPTGTKLVAGQQIYIPAAK